MAAILPGYEYDIFISYRQKDNKSDQWVTNFVNYLQEEINSTFKEEITIYFDENPHDGLQEHHEVDGSLKDKLKCLILIPIVSQTYCDPKAFAWEHEFKVFVEQASADNFGLKTKLIGGNVASRVLPVKIHEIDRKDKQLFESITGGMMRSIDFIYQETGVNRPLLPSDSRSSNQESTDYRNQVNKVANAIKGIIAGMQHLEEIPSLEERPETKKEPRYKTPKLRAKRKLNFRVPQMNKTMALGLALITSLIALVVITFIHFSAPIPDNPTFKATILPPENMSFIVNRGGHIALSPDGRLLAFVARDSLGKQKLWVRPLNSISGQALNGTEGATYPFWSPDSRFIGFFANRKLKKIEASGGPAQTVCEAPIGRGGAWNQDGTIVFCPSVQSPIYRVSDTGGLPTRVTQLDSSSYQGSHRWPCFLPDGRHFLFTARDGGITGGENQAIFLASLDTTFIPRILINSSSSVDYANGYLLYAREQTLMAQSFDLNSLQTTGNVFPIAEKVYYESLTNKTAFSVSQNGELVYQTGSGNLGAWISWYDRNGKKVSKINPPSFYFDIRLSPDGKRIAASQMIKTNMDIWTYEIDRAVWTRFTFDPARDRWPTWSPDGRKIIFNSDRIKAWESFQKAASGAGSEKLLFRNGLANNQNDWSADSRFILYTTHNSETGSDIWVKPMSADLNGTSGDKKPFPFLQTTFSESHPVFSPDGHWIAYQSNESGRSEIYIRPFPGPGGKWQVSTNGGIRPRWRGDGKELFYLNNNDFITAAEVKLRPSTVKIGAVRPLFTFNRFGGGGTDMYDVTSDGRHFLVLESADKEVKSSPVTLVVNWLGHVKEK